MCSTYHVQADDLSVRLLNLSQLHQEIPETRLCNHSVGCKYSHPVQLWRGVCLRWQMAANDLVFCETTYSEISIDSIHRLGIPSYPMSVSRWPEYRDLAHKQRVHIINPSDRSPIKTSEAFQICSCHAAGVQKLKSRST